MMRFVRFRHIHWRHNVKLFLSLAVAVLLLTHPAAAADVRPNVVVILLDDLRYDALGCTGHPFVKTPNIDRIRNEGVLFRNAFVTTSLCSPSRASFLTGMYAHSHGVMKNEGKVADPDFERTPSFAQLLQKSGYETAYIGKWHIERKNDPRPGFDYWLSFSGQGAYIDPQMNENGQSRKVEGHMTDILNEHAVKFLDRTHKRPFCLYLSHKAVHGPRRPRAKDAELYADAEIPKPPNADDDLRDKPKWQRGHVLRKGKSAPQEIPDAAPPAKWDPTNRDRLNYFRLLNAVDEGVGRILETLERHGQLDNTIVIFTSDNGYFLGEHHLSDKRLMYEESLRIPFLMRYPRLVKPGTTVEQMVLNIDLAPTLLDLAGAPVAAHMHGRSIRPLLEGKATDWRRSFLYEYWVDLQPTIPDIVGVRTEDWKLVRYPNIDDLDEMYDLKNDPHEMRNLAPDPAHAEKLKDLNGELDRLMKETGYVASPAPAKGK
jgi:N-acetylglucosamine-6-sulfatase